MRIISATNKNLLDLIAQKQFREDLFFRINVIPIYLPPLRERKEDIPLLVSTFIQRLQRITGKRITGLTPTALKLFMDYSWPGNVRELKSALEYAFVVADTGKIDAEHLPPQFAPGFGAAARQLGGGGRLTGKKRADQGPAPDERKPTRRPGCSASSASPCGTAYGNMASISKKLLQP